MSAGPHVLVPHDALASFCGKLLAWKNVREDVRRHVVASLVQTSLRGVDSHGIELLPHYIRALDAGRINPNPRYGFKQTAPASGLLDADHSFGHAAGGEAMGHAITMARSAGMAAVVVRCSSHFGAAAYFSLLAAGSDMIGISCTHSTPHMLSYGGVRPYFSTNPIAFAAPCSGEEPFCLDMATAMTTYNRVLEYKRQGKRLPADWGADAAGEPTMDPDKVLSMLPIGRYKGFGLAMMVDILCSCLSGMPFGGHISLMYGDDVSQRRNLGHFVMAIDIGRFTPVAEFKSRLREMMDEVRSEPAKDPAVPVMVPGDPEKKASLVRGREGVPVSGFVWDQLSSTAKQAGIPLPAVAKQGG